MAYRRNNSGCGCLLVFFIVAGILSGIRGCTEKLINGDLKMPNLGSSRVSGGSGGYGTSNGYNVKYNQTTSPNYKSSSNDYTHTNSLPTEYREGNKSNNTNRSSSIEMNNTMPQSSTQSSNLDNTRSTIPSMASDKDDIFKIHEIQNINCPECNGTGYIKKTWTFTGESGNPCVICWKSERHEHINEPVTCYRCLGRGQILVTKE